MFDSAASRFLRICAWVILVIGILGAFYTATDFSPLVPTSRTTALGGAILILLGVVTTWALLLCVASITESLLEIRDRDFGYYPEPEPEPEPEPPPRRPRVRRMTTDA